MTTTTPIPVDPAGTYNEATWGEGGGPFSVPPDEGNGKGSTALASNDVNYEWQHLSRWVRAMFQRMIQADQGVIGSWIQPDRGSWTTGGATLDSSITASRVWILGVLVEFVVPLGALHSFGASKDTYVDLDGLGAVQYVEVANGSNPPAEAAGFVRVWKVVSDGVEVTSASELQITIPAFCDIAFMSTLVKGATTTGSLVVEHASTLGTLPADLVTIKGDATFDNDATVTGTFTTNGPTTIAGSPAAVTPNLALNGGATVASSKYMRIANSAAPALTGQVCRVGSNFVWYTGTRVQMLGSRTRAIQESSTGLLASQSIMTTPDRLTATVNLWIYASLYVQRNTVGNVTFQLETTDGGVVWSNFQNSFSIRCVDTSDANDWTHVQFGRVRIGLESTQRLYRIKVTGGGDTAQVKDSYLTGEPYN